MPAETHRHRVSMILSVALCLIFTPKFASTQAGATPKLSVHWEELTAADFREGIHRSQGTCLLPFGILEKHGPHLPLGTDLLDVRYTALHAAEQEYAVVFPEYYFGQIAEAKHEPGTMAYSRSLQLALLQETTDEMARMAARRSSSSTDTAATSTCCHISRSHNSTSLTIMSSTFSTSVPRTMEAQRRKPKSTCTPAKAKPPR